MVVRPSITKGIPNTFLRKTRKWPHSPYITKWHHYFLQQQALLSLKKSSQTQTNPSLLINSLIDSFKSYNIEPTPNAYSYVLNTLAQKSHFNELNIVLNYLEKNGSYDTPERIFVDLIRVYGDNGMVKEAIDLFFRIPLFRCVPTVRSLNSLITVLCRSKELLWIVPQLLLKSRVVNIRVDESSFFVLAKVLCRIGKVDYALKLLNYMLDYELDPDDRLYSFILSALCKQKMNGSGSGFEVVGAFEDMRTVGFCPGRDDFRNVIKLLSRLGKGRAAFDVLCDMKRDRIKPDIVSYTMVLYGLVEQGEYVRAEELFDEVLLFGLIPNVRTYNVYIKGLCKQKKVDDAYRMVGSMEELGCPANVVTYSTILEGFCKTGELSRAREVWLEMNLKGLEPRSEAYTIMIDGFVKGGETIEGCNWLEEMLSKGFTPMSSALDDIVDSLCHEGLLAKAVEIVAKLSNHEVVIGLRSWEALLLGLKLEPDCVKAEFAKLVN